ncbi:MAG: hypothetical protein SPE54_01985, partial [Sodaliphilus sp.]|nr:hypothetical protein [Sodaliphilus sp.]
WHRQKNKNRSPSAKNQSSEIRLSENANKKILQFLLHCRWLYLTQIPQISQIFLLIALNLTEFACYQ